MNWSVEWVLPDGQTTISKCLDATEVGVAFYRIPLAKELGLVNEGDNRAKKKRKVAPGISVATANQQAAVQDKPEALDGHEAGAGVEGRHGNDDDEATRNERDLSRTLSPDLPENPEQLPSPSHTNSQTSQFNGEEILAEPDSAAIPNNSSKAQQEDSSIGSLHFYLHRPRTRARVPVLIPISESMTLAEVLYDRVVLEFPTIYVLQHPKDVLPKDKYMLNSKYLLEHGELGCNEEEESSEDEAEKIASVAAAKKLAEVDEMKVLEVLRKDLENNVDVSL